MPNKLQFYSEFAERTARQITGSYRSWTAFLATAARLYKYADCVEGAVEKGVIIGSGVYEPGNVKNTLAMKQAYEMGKNV